MEYLALISLNNQNLLEKKKLFWGKQYLENFFKYLPQEKITKGNLRFGYIYFSNSTNQINNKDISTKSIFINIKNISITETFISLEFDVIREEEIPSDLIKRIARNYLKRENKITQNELTPFLVIANKKIFDDMMESDKLKNLIELNFEKRNWKEIANIIEQIEDLENSTLWYDLKILGKIGFAFAKLSECTLNLKKTLKTKEAINQYLIEKKKNRLLAEKIFNRCIEIDKTNPSNFSALAYLYYQSAQELTLPGGRRDENLFNVVDKALLNINAALELDYKRLNDHYRKAYLFSNTLLKKVKYTANKENVPDKFRDTKLLLNEGIQSYERILSIFESETEENIKKRFLNIYLKSLYNLADLYENSINVKPEKLYHLVNIIFPNISIENINNWSHYKNKYLKKSLEYSEKCIRFVNNKFIPSEEESDIINLLTIEDSLKVIPLIPTKLKAYQLAKIYFKLYLINDEKSYLEQAKKILFKAIQFKNSSNIDYSYIYNLLALVLTLLNQPSLALDVILNLEKKVKLPPYIQITKAISLITLGEFDRAERILQDIAPINSKNFDHQKNKSIFYEEALFWLFIIKKQTNSPLADTLYKMKILKNNLIYADCSNTEINLKTNNPEICKYLIVNHSNIYHEITLQILKKN